MPLKVGHYWPTSQTPFTWRFTGRRIIAQHIRLVWSSFSHDQVIEAFQWHGPVILSDLKCVNADINIIANKLNKNEWV